MEQIETMEVSQAVSTGETQGARRATGDFPARGGTEERRRAVDPEVLAKATRRQFSGEYKRRILREAAVARASGEIGALLRREGLYSSHLNTWQGQRERGELAGLSPKRRGRKEKAINPLNSTGPFLARFETSSSSNACRFLTIRSPGLMVRTSRPSFFASV